MYFENKNDFQTDLSDWWMGSKQIILHQIRVNLGVIAMKWWQSTSKNWNLTSGYSLILSRSLFSFWWGGCLNPSQWMQLEYFKPHQQGSCREKNFHFNLEIFKRFINLNIFVLYRLLAELINDAIISGIS